MQGKVNRRNFLRTCAAATATLACPPFLLGATKNTVRLGVIGCSGRAEYLLGFLSKIDGIQIAAVCDPDSERAAAFAQKYPDAPPMPDFRVMLEDKSIDAVLVAPCNHWHVLAAILAMLAGKDVYVEKPLCMTFAEGARLAAAAEKTGRICQVGTQMRSDLDFYAEGRRFLHDEQQLGKINSVRINRFAPRPAIGKRDTPLVLPPTVDYDLWCGPAEIEPLYRDKLHYDWHWMWRTGHGEMGNWGAHLIDDCRNLVLRDMVKTPKRVLCGGARIGYNDAGQTPNESFTLFDTGSIPVVIAISNLPDKTNKKSAGSCKGPRDSGVITYAEGGRLEKWWGGAKAYDADGKPMREFKALGVSGGGAGVEPHLANFIDAVKTQDATILNAPVTVGLDTAAWYNSANIAYRLGKPYSAADVAAADTSDGRLAEAVENIASHLALQGLALNADTFTLSEFLTLDGASGRFVGDGADAANALGEISYRKGYELPTV